jgi:hypothetical protein
MSTPNQENFIKEIIKVIDRWSFEQCAHCENGTMVSIDGMIDFKCSKCGKPMTPTEYLGEIAKITFSFREKNRNFNDKI